MDFIDTDDVKTYLGITGSDEDDILDIIVASVNDFIPQYCGRSFDNDTYTELYDGPGHAALQLKHYPIISITTIEVDTYEIEERDDVDEIGWYIEDYNSGVIYNNNLWDRGRGNIEVVYTAGYTALTLPNDLKHAALELAAYFRNVRGKAGVISEGLGSYSYAVATGINSMGGELVIPNVTVRNILERYREHTYPWDCF